MDRGDPGAGGAIPCQGSSGDTNPLTPLGLRGFPKEARRWPVIPPPRKILHPPRSKSKDREGPPLLALRAEVPTLGRRARWVENLLCRSNSPVLASRWMWWIISPRPDSVVRRGRFCGEVWIKSLPGINPMVFLSCHRKNLFQNKGLFAPSLPRRGCTPQPRVAERTLGPGGRGRVYPERVVQASGRAWYNPFRVEPTASPGSQGALRDPGLWCATPSG